MSLSDKQTQVLLLIPLAGFLLYLLDREEEKTTTEQTVVVYDGDKKEVRFLRFNQDGVYGNLLATEEHFRNLKGNNDFNQCAVKHLALSANHADEAVSHTVAVGAIGDSQKYAKLRDDIRDLQHDVQDGKISSEQGINRVRTIKHEFEAFNPSFDVSRCKSCTVT